jgi:hypothetical protein
MRVRDSKMSCSHAASSLHRPFTVVKSPCSFCPGAVLVRVLASAPTTQGTDVAVTAPPCAVLRLVPAVSGSPR